MKMKLGSTLQSECLIKIASLEIQLICWEVVEGGGRAPYLGELFQNHAVFHQQLSLHL